MTGPKLDSSSPAVDRDRVEALENEVEYWRADLGARLWRDTALYLSALKRGKFRDASEISCLLRPALASYDAVQAGEWHTRCDACGEFVLPGEPTLSGQDMSGHARCFSEDGEGSIWPYGDEDLARRAEEARGALALDDDQIAALTATPDPAISGAGIVEVLVEALEGAELALKEAAPALKFADFAKAAKLALDAQKKAREALRIARSGEVGWECSIKAVSSDGKRWRLVGSNFEMQPVGEITADEAKALCQQIVAALSAQPAAQAQGVEDIAQAISKLNNCAHPFPCRFCDDDGKDIDAGAGCRIIARAALDVLRTRTAETPADPAPQAGEGK